MPRSLWLRAFYLWHLIFAYTVFFLYFCIFLLILNLYHHGKISQTTLKISAQQLNLNFYGLTFVFVQQATPQFQPSPSVSPETIVPPAGKESNSDSSLSAPDFSSEIIDSIIFTKKAKKEAKEPAIIQALQKSIQGRRDKTRAFVDELQSWQKEAYVDARFNAQVMYDELEKLMPLPFGYEVFKKHYNNTRG